MVAIMRLLPISGIQCERFGGRIVYYPLVNSRMQCWLVPTRGKDVIHCLNGKSKRMDALCDHIRLALHQVASANNYAYDHFQWYIHGEYESIMDDATMVEALMVYTLAKTMDWPLDAYGLAMVASKVANTMDNHYYGFSDLYAYMLSLDHPHCLIYIDTLMASYRVIPLVDDGQVKIYRYKRWLNHRQQWLNHFKTNGSHAFETLGIFYPIHSLASVSSSELSETKSQLDPPSYQVANYVIEQSETSDAIASYHALRSFDCIKLIDDLPFKKLYTIADRKGYGHTIAIDPLIKPVGKRIPCGHYWYVLSWI